MLNFALGFFTAVYLMGFMFFAAAFTNLAKHDALFETSPGKYWFVVMVLSVAIVLWPISVPLYQLFLRNKQR